MNTKSLFFCLIFLWSLISCSDKVLESPTNPADQTKNPSLKSASLNYYVSPSGNDNNPGTLASPFKTFQKGHDMAVAGDTIVFMDGTYTTTAAQMAVINKAGTSGAQITFKSQHKWGAVLDGGGTTSECFIFYGGASTYLNFVDFEIKNFTTMGFDDNDGSNISSYINIQGCKIHDIGRTDNTQGYGICAVYLRMKNHHWTITRNLMYNIGRTGPDTYYLNKDHCVYTGTVDTPANAAHDIAITYNVMYSVSGATLNLSSINDLVYNNVMAWRNSNSQGSSAFVWTDSNVTGDVFANNIFYQVPSSNPFALYAAGSASTFTVKNNMVYGGRMWGTTSGTSSSMKGNNFGQTDCENAQVDPKFVSAILANSPNVDFSLQASSPAINVGVNVGLTADILKKSIVGLPDIGAYEYQGQGGIVPPPSTVYYNALVSGTATKNSCGTGYTGSTVTYTVAASKYSSTISQADADSKALADVTANKQTYANTNGTCTAGASTTFYSAQQSGTATKNSCGTGYTGSTVTYTVAASKYSSNISQADADSKALADVTANKQAYANTNGTCTAAAVTTYYCAQQSGTATKNSCGTGYTGSTVTYTVPAEKYTSTLSQAMADSYAIADVTANKQAYANANGTCTKKRWWQH